LLLLLLSEELRDSLTLGFILYGLKKLPIMLDIFAYSRMTRKLTRIQRLDAWREGFVPRAHTISITGRVEACRVLRMRIRAVGCSVGLAQGSESGA